MASFDDLIGKLKDVANAAEPAGDAGARLQDLTDAIRGLEAAEASLTKDNLVAQLDALNDIIRTEERRSNLTAKETRMIREQIAVVRELRGEMASVDAVYKQQSARIRGMMGITDAWKKTAVGAMFEMHKAGGSFRQQLGVLSGAFESNITKAEVFGSVAMKISEMATVAWAAVVKQTFDLVTAQDRAMVSIMRTTGATRKFGQMAMDVESSMFKFGVTIEDASQAMMALYQSSTGFTQMSERSQQVMAESVSLLVRFGVSAESQAKNIEVLNRSLGMTGIQATQMNQALFQTARELGISTTKMVGEFSSFGTQLMKFGQDVTRVYIQLQYTAKNTGIEISRLLDITSKFDQFDTAAQSVGKLNALLGGPYLSTIRMVMMTDPTQRMQALAQATRDAGKSFDTLSYYERLALTNAMGLKDVNELALIMRNRFDLVSGSVKRSSHDIEKLAQQTHDFNTVSDQFKQVMRLIAIELGRDVLPMLRNLATFLKENEGVVVAWAKAIFYLVSAFKALSIISTIAPMFGVFLGAGGGLAASVGLVAAAAAGFLYFANQLRGMEQPITRTDAGLRRLSIGLEKVVDAGAPNSWGLPDLAANVDYLSRGLERIANTPRTVDVRLKAVEDLATVTRAANLTVAANMGQIAYPAQQVRQPIEVRSILELDGRQIDRRVTDVIVGIS